MTRQLMERMRPHSGGTAPLVLFNLIRDASIEFDVVAAPVTDIDISGGVVRLGHNLTARQIASVTWCWRMPEDHQPFNHGWTPLSSSDFYDRVSSATKADEDPLKSAVQYALENLVPGGPPFEINKEPAWPADFCEGEKTEAENAAHIFVRNVTGLSFLRDNDTGALRRVGQGLIEINLDDINCCAGGNG